MKPNTKHMKYEKRILLYVCLAAILWACQPGSKKQKSIDDQIETQVTELLKQMTLKEKIGMIHGNSKFTTAGVERLGIPEWHLSDGPHGVREEIERDSWNPAGWTTDSSSYFPTGTAVAATWNPGLARIQGKALGEEARYRKKDIILGPGINVIRTPLCGRNFEYLSEDPFLISQMSVPYIQGIQSADVAACVKHYIGNNQEIDRGTVDVKMNDRTFNEIYLPGFRSAIREGGAYTLMVAYNKFRGKWCCENSFLLTDVLRKDIGFKGVTLSDWAAVHSTIETANAGLDLEMGTDSAYNRYYFADPLIKAVKEGKVSESIIDKKVKNILRIMFKTKILGNEKRAEGSFVSPEHQQVAYKVAAESIVLLKNDNNILPVSPSTVKTIAVIGDNADRKHAPGGYSSGLKAKYEITPLQGLKNRIGRQVKLKTALGYEKNSEILYGKGLTVKKDKKKDAQLLSEAVKLARTSDVAIIFAGINHDYDTEGEDRPDMELPYNQEKLILEVTKVNPRTIVVITSGSPLNLSRIKDHAEAIVWGWYNGMEGGHAMADVLTGKINPSGKLPFTIPVSLKDCPAHETINYPGIDLQVKYDEGILVGYRWYDTKEIDPLYPFGYGLSYTTFRYDSLKTDKEVYNKQDSIKVCFKLTNTGKMAGAETAELYVSDPDCSVMRPAKELKGFKKVFLAPGESKPVTIIVPASNLAYYSENDKEWIVEPGRFEMLVNSSSADNRLSASIAINQ